MGGGLPPPQLPEPALQVGWCPAGAGGALTRGCFWERFDFSYPSRGGLLLDRFPALGKERNNSQVAKA